MWKSASTDQVKAFCSSQAISHEEIKMACVMQWQVESMVAGVAMTSTGGCVRDQYLLLNFAAGACENVVDGKSTNEIVFAKDQGIAVSATCKDFGDLFWDTAVPHRVFRATPSARGWDLETLARVATICAKVEDVFARPMDIEWCVDHDGEIFLLQARPIVHRQAIALMTGM